MTHYGYGVVVVEQMDLLLLQLGLYLWDHQRIGQGLDYRLPFFGDPGGVLKGESLPFGDDAGVRKILASTSPVSEESESWSTGKYPGVGSNKGCSGLPPARVGSIHWRLLLIRSSLFQNIKVWLDVGGSILGLGVLQSTGYSMQSVTKVD